jgi:perosamine synthetase
VAWAWGSIAEAKKSLPIPNAAGIKPPEGWRALIFLSGIPVNITQPAFDQSEIELVKQCLDSKWVTQGPLTQKFEALFADRHAVEHALATTSCTAALHIAAMALDLGPGDEVIVPAFTWITSANCAEYVGAKAVFADIDLATFNLDPKAVEAALTPRTKAIVAVHLFGLAAPMAQLKAIADKHGLVIIEDAACAVGSTYQGKLVGGLGDIGCFSFHPRKVITTGEGGMLTTNQKALADRIAVLRNHGATGPAPGADPSKPYTMSTFNRLGFNLRLSDIQAAVGVAQMAKLDRLLAERRRLALRYTELLTGTDSLVTPTDDGGHSFQSYVVRLNGARREQRNAVMDALAAHDIQTRPGTHAVHRLGYYVDKYGLRPEQFPNACLAEDTTITLPIFPGMTDDQQQMVVGIFKTAQSAAAGAS